MAKGRAKRLKREWRKLPDPAADAALEARGAAEAAELPDAELFFADDAPAAARPRLSRKERARATVLRTDAVLQRSTLGVTPYPAPDARRHAPSAARPPQRAPPRAPPPPPADTADTADAYDVWSTGAPRKAARKLPRRPDAAPGVVVCAPGCSVNPPTEAHQEAIALAVAVERRKELREQLAPLGATAVPTNRLAEEPFAHPGDGGGEEDEGSDDSDGDASGDDSDAAGAAAARAAKARKLTKTERNKAARAKERAREEAAARAAKAQRRDLSELKRVRRELDEAEAEREAKRARREATRAERAASGEAPARLGKVRYTPEPVAVLTTEEAASGSLRRVKGAVTVLRDRYKSLQRRELVEPRNRAPKRKGNGKIVYEPGARGTKEREMHEANLAVTVAKTRATKRRGADKPLFS